MGNDDVEVILWVGPTTPCIEPGRRELFRGTAENYMAFREAVLEVIADRDRVETHIIEGASAPPVEGEPHE